MVNLVDVVRDIHYKGYVFNDLDPRKIFVGFDKDIYLSSQVQMTKIGDPIIEKGSGLSQYKHCHLLERGDRKIDFVAMIIMIQELVLGEFGKCREVCRY